MNPNKRIVYFLRKLSYAILFLFAFVVFSLSSLFAFAMTCNQNYCYYKNCNKNNFDEKVVCFTEKTNNFNNWMLLDLIFSGYILSVLFVVFIARTLCEQIKKLIITHNYYRSSTVNSKFMNKRKSFKNYILPLESLKESIEQSSEESEEESLEIDKRNCLFVV